MQFDALYQPFASNRYCITARNGMVATGSALASQAGLEVLKKGGNAVDAAVASAAALTVVEPTANGLGSDAFALVWINADKHLYGLNASGYSPMHASLEKMQERCPGGKIPRHGWLPVMVPGAVKGWASLVSRFGRLSLKEDLAPAVSYAQEGYPLSPLLASMWEKAAASYHREFDGHHEFDEWFRVFTKNGESFHFGDMVKLPDHARTLKLIADSNAEAFYQGEIADAAARQSERDGGFFTKEDFSSYETEWVDPISVDYRGYTVNEIPPNGQGITALMALNILSQFTFTDRNPRAFHQQIEAMKTAFADSLHFVADPHAMKVDFHDFLKPEYGMHRAAQITDAAGLPTFEVPPKSGTVYLAAADYEGNMVSYIQSNYMGFGSGIVIEGYGIAMQNRGADFSLNPSDANAFAPHKKCYHTIIPGFLTKGSEAVGPFGVMGGYMQPQGHVQVLMNMIDFHLNPQMALDAPRWQWLSRKKVLLEPQFDKAAAAKLARMGHEIEIAADSTSFGRGQIILRKPDGVLIGGTESRTDSNITCW